jgi:tetratricopeptide (TPR) repeat protein
MRLRRQALLEWRTAVEIQPLQLRPLLSELFAQGAKPEELGSLASGSPARLLEVAEFLEAKGRTSDSFVVLDQADALGAPRAETLLSRAILSFDTGNLDAAASAAGAAAAAGAKGPKLPILQARIVVKQSGAEGADRALAILDRAAAQYPTDLPLQRERVAVVTRYEKWSSAARAIEGLKLASYHATGSAAEAHVAAAAIAGYMGRPTVAMDEYRMALADRANDAGVWLAYGHAAEAAGRDVVARDAFSQAERLSPKDPVITRAMQALDEHAARSRVQEPSNPARPLAGP